MHFKYKYDELFNPVLQSLHDLGGSGSNEEIEKKVSDTLLRKHALASARLPLGQVDRCPEDLLNRILWHAMKGSEVPYPAWAVRPVRDLD